MPRDNIERAIKRGTGEIGGDAIEECVYGGYGPGGVAVIVEALTDNRARTAGEIRNLFDKRGGKMADLAAVSNLFDKKTQLVIRKDACPEEALMEAALAHGADNIETVGTNYEVTGEVVVFDSLRKGLEEQKIPVESAELAWLPRMTIPLDRTLAEKVLALLDDLEEHEDVKATWANLEVSEADLSAMGG
jgi:YebC/PmpR family DNA-binding regulatory protein